MALKSKFGLGYRLHCVRAVAPCLSAPSSPNASGGGGAGDGVGDWFERLEKLDKLKVSSSSYDMHVSSSSYDMMRLEKLEGWVKLHVAKAKVVASSPSEVTFELGLPDAQAARGASSHDSDHGHCGPADDHGRDMKSEDEGSGDGGAQGEGVGGGGGAEREGRGGGEGGAGGGDGGGGRGCDESKSKLAVSKCSKVRRWSLDIIQEIHQVTDVGNFYVFAFRQCCGGSTPP